jgi:hypothetical protein
MKPYVVEWVTLVMPGRERTHRERFASIFEAYPFCQAVNGRYWLETDDETRFGENKGMVGD